jgi:hypothetical protein
MINSTLTYTISTFYTILWQMVQFLGEEQVNIFQPTRIQQYIEGLPLLGNRTVNTCHSNECATTGRPLQGNTPRNSTWYPLLSSWCAFCGWSVSSLHRKQWRLFEKISVWRRGRIPPPCIPPSCIECILTSCLFKNHLNSDLSPTQSSKCFSSLQILYVFLIPVIRATCPSPSQSHCFDHSDNNNC